MHDLSSDVLRKVIRLLPDKNVAHFAMTCTRARDLVAEVRINVVFKALCLSFSGLYVYSPSRHMSMLI